MEVIRTAYPSPGSPSSKYRRLQTMILRVNLTQGLRGVSFISGNIWPSFSPSFDHLDDSKMTWKMVWGWSKTGNHLYEYRLTCFSLFSIDTSRIHVVFKTWYLFRHVFIKIPRSCEWSLGWSVGGRYRDREIFQGTKLGAILFAKVGLYYDPYKWGEATPINGRK